MKNNLYVGTMSGTSVDGLDVSIVNFIDDNNFKLIDYKEYPYTNELKEKILKASNSKSNTEEICKLNFELANFYSESILDIISKNNISSNEIKGIGSHGQTIFHINSDENSTLQICDGSVIAKQTGINTVSDFRPSHIGSGGLGAPLVPFGDYMLYKENGIKTIWQNIGGISNSTILSDDINNTISFDNGPGNMIIDYIVKNVFGLEYDNNGDIASQGKINNELLGYLLEEKYYKLSIPKSTGRELFNDEYCQNIINKGYDKYDTLRTVTYLTAYTIYHSLFDVVGKDKLNDYQLIVSGGGAYNQTLMNDLKELFSEGKVFTAEDKGYNASAKESVIFAYFAYRTLNLKHSAIVNGKEVILGKVSYK